MATDRDSASQGWRLKGDYFENCNCEILCPCIVQGAEAVPTEGHCDVGFAFHIEEGDFNGTILNGLNFAVIAYTPGIMGAGNWSTAVYIDEAADEGQREALGSILSGRMGGPAERWMLLTANFLGIKYSPITYVAEGRTRSVSIPEIMNFSVEGIMSSRRATEPMRLENTSHPVNSSLALARGTGSTYTDYGMSWDNTGKNGHYSTFEWRWP
jgi:hypothetical protein